MTHMLNREEVEKRISTANGAGLVAILYEALIENFKDSIQCLEDKKYDELKYINSNSRDILAQLISTLEGNSEIAGNLMSIYIYLNKLITNGEAKRDKTSFENSIKIVRPLYEGFKELEKKQNPKVIMGLTYGKGQLEECVLEGNKVFKG